MGDVAWPHITQLLLRMMAPIEVRMTIGELADVIDHTELLLPVPSHTPQSSLDSAVVFDGINDTALLATHSEPFTTRC